MRPKILTVFTLLFLLIGCSDSGSESYSLNEITINDLSIHIAGDKSSKVTYGMTRSDAEKVLGKGERSELFKNYYTYESDVSVLYREDIVVGITLGEESANEFQTLKGAKVGILRDDFKKMYGEKYVVLENNERYIDFVYDSTTNEYITNINSVQVQEDKTKTYMVSAMFDSNGYASIIMVQDRHAAINMR